jgi:hypothetical protein
MFLAIVAVRCAIPPPIPMPDPPMGVEAFM